MGAGSLTVPAPIKPASAVHEGAPADQPMNAATLALFAHVTTLESDIRAAREAEQDQAALHGRLWAELVAAEAKVEAVPVPIATPTGASAAMRRIARRTGRARGARYRVRCVHAAGRGQRSASAAMAAGTVTLRMRRQPSKRSYRQLQEDF